MLITTAKIERAIVSIIAIKSCVPHSTYVKPNALIPISVRSTAHKYASCHLNIDCLKKVALFHLALNMSNMRK